MNRRGRQPLVDSRCIIELPPPLLTDRRQNEALLYIRVCMLGSNLCSRRSQRCDKYHTLVTATLLWCLCSLCCHLGEGTQSRWFSYRPHRRTAPLAGGTSRGWPQSAVSRTPSRVPGVCELKGRQWNLLLFDSSGLGRGSSSPRCLAPGSGPRGSGTATEGPSALRILLSSEKIDEMKRFFFHESLRLNWDRKWWNVDEEALLNAHCYRFRIKTG